MTSKQAGHISAEVMRGYARGTLEETERERVDTELLGCEQCLELFMNVLENESNMSPSEERGLQLREMPNLAALEERVVAELARTAKLEPGNENSMDAYGDVDGAANGPLSPKSVNDGYIGAAAGAAAPQIQSAPVRRRPAASRPAFIQRPVVQYTIAASITLLLLASGALAGFTQGLEKLDESHVAMPPQAAVDNGWRDQPSWSDQLVNRTGSWLDGIQASRFK